jgi:hypothetical protein
MWRYLIGLFLIAHGLLHVAVWAIPKSEVQSFDPHHSWALEGAGMRASSVHRLAMTMAWVAAVAFVVGGAMLMTSIDLWRPVTIAASVLGLAMSVVWFHPWFIVDVAINAGLLIALTGWDVAP